MSYQEEQPDDDIPEVNIQPPSVLAHKLWSQTDTGHDLTLEEALFCRSYIVDRNPIAALKRLDYEGSMQTLKRMAERHLANPEVIGCINTLAKQMMEKLDITAEKVNKHLANMAFFDIRQIAWFDGTSMQVLDSRLWPEEAVAAVQSVKQTKDAGIEIKMVDKLTATKQLAAQLNLLQDPDEMDKKRHAEAAAEAVVNRIAQIAERVALTRAAEAPEVPEASETVQ